MLLTGPTYVLMVRTVTRIGGVPRHRSAPYTAALKKNKRGTVVSMKASATGKRVYKHIQAGTQAVKASLLKTLREV